MSAEILQMLITLTIVYQLCFDSLSNDCKRQTNYEQTNREHNIAYLESLKFFETPKILNSNVLRKAKH